MNEICDLIHNDSNLHVLITTPGDYQVRCATDFAARLSFWIEYAVFINL